MIKAKQNIRSGIFPRLPTAYKVTKIDCYMPQISQEEAEICLNCDLPKCKGDIRGCKRYREKVEEIKQKNGIKRIKRKGI